MSTGILKKLKLYNVSQYISLIIYILRNEKIKCAFVVNIDSNFPFPTVRYNVGQTITSFHLDFRPDIYIANMENITAKQFFSVISSNFEYNPKAKFIFIGNQMRYITRQLSIRFITDVVFLSSIQGKIRTQTTNDILKQKYVKAAKKSNMRICFYFIDPYISVKSSGNELTGLKVELIQLIFGIMNLTATFVPTVYSAIRGDTSTYLLSGDCDMIGIPLQRDNGLLDIIEHINDDFMMWFVPRPAKVPKWKYVFEVFNYKVWINIVFTTMIVVAVWLYSDKVGKINFQWDFISITKKFLSIAKVAIDQSNALKLTNFSQVVLLGSTFLCIVIVNLMYKSQFTSLFQNQDLYEEGIDSCEDFIEKGFDLLVTEVRLHEVTSMCPSLKNYPKEKIFTERNYPVFDNWLNMVAKSKKLAVYRNVLSFQSSYKKYLDENHYSLIQSLDNSRLRFMLGYLFLKGNPIPSRITPLISKLRDYGCIQHLVSKYDSRTSKFNVKETQQFGTGDILGPVKIWIAGCCVGLLVFFMEIMKAKIGNMKKFIFKKPLANLHSKIRKVLPKKLTK
ncbi:hypothetical protein WA026_020377 [Henosepilachna vigintioctopunctata]|uniref:Uncharacterized protein n=1 Tax=Henosepilachna vigintioctopunctata TaxID=420089 RepID=A0AAW1UR14_9CUCU